MPQMLMNPQWTMLLNAREMKIVTLALCGKLKTEDQKEQASVLLEEMTRQRLAVMQEQSNNLVRHLPENDGETDEERTDVS